MTRTTMKASPFALRVARKSAIVAAMCAAMLVAGIVYPSYAYGDTLSSAQSTFTSAKNELIAANDALAAANEAFANVNAKKILADKATTQANSSAGIISDVVFSGQTPLYAQVDGVTGMPAASTLVGVEGMYVNGNGEGWTQDRVVSYINQIRQQAKNEGLVSAYVPVSWSRNLERTAQVRAAEISIYGDHTRPSGEKWHGVSNEGLMQGSAENLSWGSTYYGNIEMWVKEKECYRQYVRTGKNPGCVYGHYRNLVNPQYNKVGIAQFNSNRGSVNPYNTAMAAEFSGSGVSGSADVKALNQTVYQGVYAKTSALGAIGAGGATTFSPTAVSGDPVWTKSASVKEAKTLAKSMASAEWTRIQSDFNAKKAAAQSAQNRVNTAKSNYESAKKQLVAAGGAAPNEQTMQMFRLCNATTGEHLFTADTRERDGLRQRGWVYEGVAWVAPAQSSAPVYRLYNPATTDHHYATDLREVNALVTKHGWKNEGIAWYSDDLHSYAIYRQYNSGRTIGSHNYTGDLTEYAVNNTRSWQGESVAWYGVRAQ